MHYLTISAIFAYRRLLTFDDVEQLTLMKHPATCYNATVLQSNTHKTHYIEPYDQR